MIEASFIIVSVLQGGRNMKMSRKETRNLILVTLIIIIWLALLATFKVLNFEEAISNDTFFLMVAISSLIAGFVLGCLLRS